MKIIKYKKRVALLSLLAAATVGVTAVQAGAIGPQLALKGEGSFCLTTKAADALAAQNVTMEPLAPATGTGNCVTLPGSGTLSPDLAGGSIPLEGGMRFNSPGHRLDVTNLHIHSGKRSTSADFAQDGAAATNLDFVHYEISFSNVSIGLRTVDTTPTPLTLTAPAATAFTDAFGTSPAPAGAPAFLFEGHAEIVNPFSSLPKS